MRRDFENAVFLFGHGIFLGGDPMNDHSWILLPYQQRHAPIFFNQSKRFCEELSARGKHWLGIISGGQSRPDDRCVMPESTSYRQLIQQAGYFGLDIAEQCTEEWFALDSMTNMAFALARFCEVTSRLPKRVCCISLGFKSERVRWHFDTCLQALNCGPISFEFIDGGMPPDDLLEDALASEARTLSAWKAGPFVGPAGKANTRNPYCRAHGYGALKLAAPLIRAIEQAQQHGS